MKNKPNRLKWNIIIFSIEYLWLILEKGLD